jgi:predicted phosphate transport protein (TIGR00153 family)
VKKNEDRISKNEELGLKKQLFRVIIIAVLVFLIGSASGIHRAIISLLTDAITGTEDVHRTEGDFNFWFQLAFALAPFGLFKASADIFSGELSDKYGRRKMMILGTFIYLFGVIPIVLSLGLKSINETLAYLMLPLGSAIIGAGQGCLYASTMASLGDIGGHRERATAMGIMESSVYGGYSIGSAISGFISKGGEYQNSYIFATITAVFAAIIAISAIRETIHLARLEEKISPLREIKLPKKDIKKIEKKYRLKTLLRNPSLIVTYLNGHISKFADTVPTMMVLYWGTLFIEKSGDPDAAKTGLIVAAFTLTWAISMILAGGISDRLGRKGPCSFGLILQGICFLGFIIITGSSTEDFYLLILFSAGAGIGAGFYYPTLPAISMDVAPPAVKGRVIGLYRATRDLGYLTGPFVLAAVAYMAGGAFEDLRYSVGLTVLLLFLGSLLITFVVRETRPWWIAYEEAVLHAEKVMEAVNEAQKSIECHVEGNRDYCIVQAKIAKKREQEADELKRRTRERLLTTVRRTPDRTEFFRLSKDIDRVAGRTDTASFKLSRLKPEIIHNDISSLILVMINQVKLLMNSVLASLKSLDISYDQALVSVKEIEHYESVIDQTYSDLIAAIYRHEREFERVSYILTLKEIADLLEYAADSAEGASNLIRALAIKHQP